MWGGLLPGMAKDRKILPGLTTTRFSNWREKVKEIDEYQIKEIALFPTCLNPAERKELYALLEETKLRSIPHVHAMAEFEEAEMDYLAGRFQVERFNLHPRPDAFRHQKSKHWKKVFIENLHHYIAPDERNLFSPEAFERYSVAGICLDLSHLENERLIFPGNYLKTLEMIEKFKIGCNHISGIAAEPTTENVFGIAIYDIHRVQNRSQLDYLKKMPLKFFSDIVSIELENSFREQLEAKKYIEDIIKEKKKGENIHFNIS